MTKCCHTLPSATDLSVTLPKVVCRISVLLAMLSLSTSSDLLADEQSRQEGTQPVRAQIQPVETAEVIVANKNEADAKPQQSPNLINTNLSPPPEGTTKRTGTKISRPKPAPLDGSDSKPSGAANKRMLQTVIGSLAIVLGAFMLLIWFFKRNAPAGARQLPSDVLEVLGSAPVGNRQQYQLLRLGRRLVLVNVHSQGVETITEVIDPREVARLTGMCQQNQSNSITESFRQVLEQFGEEPASGFIDNTNRSDQELAQGRQRSRRPTRSQFSEVV